MSAKEVYVCDGPCGREVEPREAHGWYGVQTMVHPSVPLPVRKLNGTFCSLDCLVEWADDKAFEEPVIEAPTAVPYSYGAEAATFDAVNVGQYL